MQAAGLGGKMSQSNDFVSYVFSIIASDKGARADFRRADNDAYEWRIWPYLSRFIADLDEDVYRRRVYALIGSAIAKSRSDEDGQVPFGMAFRKLSKDNGGTGKRLSLTTRQLSPTKCRTLVCAPPEQ